MGNTRAGRQTVGVRRAREDEILVTDVANGLGLTSKRCVAFMVRFVLDEVSTSAFAEYVRNQTETESAMQEEENSKARFDS